MVKERGRKLIAQNRKARHDWSVLDTYETGIVLTGTEVKSLRQGKASLVDAFATVDEGEVCLRNAHIPEYTEGTWTNHEPRRSRKLLLHGWEQIHLTQVKHQRLPEPERTAQAVGSEGWGGSGCGVRVPALRPPHLSAPSSASRILSGRRWSGFTAST